MKDFITKPKISGLYILTFDYIVGQIVIPLHIHLISFFSCCKNKD